MEGALCADKRRDALQGCSELGASFGRVGSKKSALIPIHAESSSPCNAVLAVAIKQTSAADRQNHVGLIFKIEGKAPSIFHLRFHHQLRCDPLDPTYYWIACKLDDRLLLPIAEHIGVIAERNDAGKIPFCIEYTGQYFDANGSYIRNGDGEGLTCATLITSLFSEYGLPLIQAETWPKTPSLKDKSWQKKILKILEEHASPQHVQRQRRLIGRVSRFRPEQIAGAFGIFDGLPVEHEVAKELGAFVDQEIGEKD